MVDRHYSLNLKPWSARTLYVYAHADLAQKYSVGLQEMFLSRLCSQEENSFFLPWMKNSPKSFLYIPFASTIMFYDTACLPKLQYNISNQTVTVPRLS
jgi:hypothetical protein